jgi:N-dimethylarginine dimethylaminohydrolase
MSIWTEWDPLEEIIVGDCYTDTDNSQLKLILKETKEDLQALADYLTSLGVKVHRPNVDENPCMAPIVPRDQYLVYGNTVYQTYTSMPDRFADGLNYIDIFTELFKQGHNWISQPPPVLAPLKETDKWWNEGKHIYQDLNKNKILWHTATMFKCGDALITNKQGPGTALGLEWMKRNLPNTRIIENNKWGHIDHGFFMIDDNTVICINEDWVPNCLKNKKLIVIEDYIQVLDYSKIVEDFATTNGTLSQEWIDKWLNEWKGYIQDVAFDSNVLVIDSKNILFSSEQPKLFKFLKQYGITCHVVNMRHSMFWEGGIHCLTLDVKRRGERRVIVPLTD